MTGFYKKELQKYEARRQDFKWKLGHYLLEGDMPWRDVFFTFDDVDGAIDTAAICDMIEHYFL